MLGVGLDSDGHTRPTAGPIFVLAGGTQETHEGETEKAIKINEKLKARGKQPEHVTHEEFDDIAHEVGLKKFEPKKINIHAVASSLWFERIGAQRRHYNNRGSSIKARVFSGVSCSRACQPRAAPAATFSTRSSKYTMSALRRPHRFSIAS